MNIELINNTLKTLQPSLGNYQEFLKSLTTGNLINDYLVVENDEGFECYYQMDNSDNSFYFTTIIK